jgi:hypothetical protein
LIKASRKVYAPSRDRSTIGVLKTARLPLREAIEAERIIVGILRVVISVHQIVPADWWDEVCWHGDVIIFILS